MPRAGAMEEEWAPAKATAAADRGRATAQEAEGGPQRSPVGEARTTGAVAAAAAGATRRPEGTMGAPDNGPASGAPVTVSVAAGQKAGQQRQRHQQQQQQSRHQQFQQASPTEGDEDAARPLARSPGQGRDHGGPPGQLDLRRQSGRPSRLVLTWPLIMQAQYMGDNGFHGPLCVRAPCQPCGDISDTHCFRSPVPLFH